MDGAFSRWALRGRHAETAGLRHGLELPTALTLPEGEASVRFCFLWAGKSGSLRDPHRGPHTAQWA